MKIRIKNNDFTIFNNMIYFLHIIYILHYIYKVYSKIIYTKY